MVKRRQEAKTKNPECFLFHEISDELEDKETGTKYVEIQAFRWGYNGSMFGLIAVKSKISEFQGPRKITELECFPWEYLEENKRNVPQLIKRGERWCEHVEAKKFYYKGWRTMKVLISMLKYPTLISNIGVAQVPTRSKFQYEINVFSKNVQNPITCYLSYY